MQDISNTFTLTGLIDLYTVHKVYAKIVKFSLGRLQIIIDCGQVEQADSALLALIISCLRDANNGNKTIRFLNLPKQCYELAKVTGLDKIINAAS